MLKELLGKGKIDNVIQKLKGSIQDKDAINTLYIIESNYNSWKDINNQGILNWSESSIIYNKICKTLLDLIDNNEDVKPASLEQNIEIILTINSKYQNYNKSQLIKIILDNLNTLLDDENIELEGFRLGSIILNLKMNENSIICLESMLNNFGKIEFDFGKISKIKRLITKDQKLMKSLNINVKPNVLFTSIEAYASNTVAVDLVEEHTTFHLPGADPNSIAFKINGTSMSPTIESGDLVICTPLLKLNEIIPNEIYAIVTNQSVWVKRVEVIKNWKNIIVRLKLISDNSREYDPFIIEIEDVRKVLKIKSRVINMGI